MGIWAEKHGQQAFQIPCVSPRLPDSSHLGDLWQASRTLPPGGSSCRWRLRWATPSRAHWSTGKAGGETGGSLGCAFPDISGSFPTQLRPWASPGSPPSAVEQSCSVAYSASVSTECPRPSPDPDGTGTEPGVGPAQLSAFSRAELAVVPKSLMNSEDPQGSFSRWSIGATASCVHQGMTCLVSFGVLGQVQIHTRLGLCCFLGVLRCQVAGFSSFLSEAEGDHQPTCMKSY